MIYAKTYRSHHYQRLGNTIGKSTESLVISAAAILNSKATLLSRIIFYIIWIHLISSNFNSKKNCNFHFTIHSFYIYLDANPVGNYSIKDHHFYSIYMNIKHLNQNDSHVMCVEKHFTATGD